MTLRLKNIRLPLASFALEVDVEITSRVTGITGPSGAGKTSLLDVVAGLRRAKSALIQLDGVTLTDTATGIFVPPRLRGIGYVPQDLALFPHLSVRQNLRYGLKPDAETEGPFAFDHIVEILDLQPLVGRSIPTLSGGEKQRVALGRALLASPRLLLLDEPLASLDHDLKARLIPYLARVRDEVRVAMLYVTHDPDEAKSLCERVLTLQKGLVVS